MQGKVADTTEIQEAEAGTEEAPDSCACFGFLEKQGFLHPFARSIGFNMRTMQMTVTPWTVTLYRLTPSGRKSKSRKGTKILVLNYCPICGRNLQKDGEKRADEATQSAVGDEYLKVPSSLVSGGSEDDSKES